MDTENCEKQNKTVEQLEKEIAFLKEIAHKDELTRLYNRRGFNEEAMKFINEIIGERENRTRREGLLIRSFSLIIFDIDHFKKVNDDYGHLAGDEALKLMSDLAKQSVRDIDIVARWGGEEIIIGLVGASINDAWRIADDIRKKVEAAELIHEGQKIKFTISGGVASLDSSRDFDDLFKKADDALYKAKESGRNNVQKAE